MGFPYDFKSDMKKMRGLQTANYINRSQKIAKMWIDMDDAEGSVNVVIGFFLAKEDDLKLYFSSYLQIMNGIFVAFNRIMLNQKMDE
jgi:hypothetical protein